MSRRLVLSLVTGALVTTGLAGSALADPSAARHKVCVGDPTTNTGWCVVWDDPTPNLGAIVPTL